MIRFDSIIQNRDNHSGARVAPVPRCLNVHMPQVFVLVVLKNICRVLAVFEVFLDVPHRIVEDVTGPVNTEEDSIPPMSSEFMAKVSSSRRFITAFSSLFFPMIPFYSSQDFLSTEVGDQWQLKRCVWDCLLVRKLKGWYLFEIFQLIDGSWTCRPAPESLLMTVADKVPVVFKYWTISWDTKWNKNDIQKTFSEATI